MLIEEKIEKLDTLRSNIKKKKVVIDETKENFGFERMKQLNKVSDDYISGIPYRLNMKDGNKFVLKVTPIHTTFEKDRNPVYIENIILKELTETFIKKYKIPNFLFYLGSSKISCKSPALKTKYFSLLNNEGVVRSKCNVLMSEYVERGSLYSYVEYKNISLELWKSIIFQVMYAIYAMQKTFKIMHNDLHHGNILIDKINENGYISYNVNGVKYYIKHNGIIPKLFDFEFAMAYKKMDGMYENAIIDDKKEYFDYFNEGVDVHEFLDSLLDFELPKELEDWIRSKYDERILSRPDESRDISSEYSTTTSYSYHEQESEQSKKSENEDATDFDNQSSDTSEPSISKGDLLIQRKILKGAEKIVKLPSPLEILTDDFFASYRDKPNKYELYQDFNFNVLYE